LDKLSKGMSQCNLVLVLWALAVIAAGAIVVAMLI
jgi:hypothetical protein